MIKAKAKTSPLRHSVHKEKQIKSINRKVPKTKRKAITRKSKDFNTESFNPSGVICLPALLSEALRLKTTMWEEGKKVVKSHSPALRTP